MGLSHFTDSLGAMFQAWSWVLVLTLLTSCGQRITNTPNTHHQPFLYFFDFWPNLHVTLWRPFQAPFSKNFIWTESFGCLISNGPDLVRFKLGSSRYHALKEGDAKLKNSGRFFLKNSYLPTWSKYRWVLLVKIS